jgi:hypothetical protein
MSDEPFIPLWRQAESQAPAAWRGLPVCSRSLPDVLPLSVVTILSNILQYLTMARPKRAINGISNGSVKQSKRTRRARYGDIRVAQRRLIVAHPAPRRSVRLLPFGRGVFIAPFAVYLRGASHSHRRRNFTSIATFFKLDAVIDAKGFQSWPVHRATPE